MVEERPSRKTPVWVWFAIANVLVLLVVAVAVVGFWPRDESDESNAATSARNQSTQGLDNARPLPSEERNSSGAQGTDIEAANSGHPGTAEIVASVRNGVVLVTTYDSSKKKLGIGTGFVIDSAGLVATNFHVLRRSSSAEVEFHDRTKVAVTAVRAWDPTSDLAVLELSQLPPQASVLTVSKTTDRVNASEVISIGHPQEFKFTTTTGIISATHKTSDLPPEYQQSLSAKPDQVWLQTTAAISGGSSGGPLLDQHGEVIGVNTWVAGNYSFAVDARYLAELIRSLPSTGRSLARLTGPDERMAKLMMEFNEKARWFNLEISRATSDQQRRELTESRHPAPEFTAHMVELVEKHPDTPMEFDCLSWICQVGAQPSAPSTCEASLAQAAERIVKNFADHPRLAQLMWSMQGTSRKGAWIFMQRIAQSSPDRNLRGIACYSLAVAKQQAGDNADRQEVLALLEQAKSEYADVVYYCTDPRHPRHVIGSEAEEALFQLKNLAVGCAAMEISGTDLAGEVFQLSDYRGKVVVLDFWADWCPPCRQMLPHERRLVEDMDDKPFALLGIFLESQSKLQTLVDGGEVTWRNWIDGRTGTIGQQWRIRSIPTVYVLDRKGTIRYKTTGLVGADQLEAWIDELLRETPEPEAG
jgi:S1-C subfamily serine protease/thiol-disulfide isomerase/thioredoxin